MRPSVLTIAGHDPSAGAGLSADLKTFEAHGAYGMSVCSAITVQNDRVFKKVRWLSESEILEQLEVLLQGHTFVSAKIGLIENGRMLGKLIRLLRQRQPGIQVVVDPVLKASAGFKFQEAGAARTYVDDLKGIALLTPNREEIGPLTGTKNPEKAALELSLSFPVLLKGGHDARRMGWDLLFVNGRKTAEFQPSKIAEVGKHGSGCVLSAALAANLGKGKNLVTACKEAKRYTENFLTSNDQLLGYHHFEPTTNAK